MLNFHYNYNIHDVYKATSNLGAHIVVGLAPDW